MSKPQQRSLFRIAAEGIVRAPRRAKLALGVNVVVLLGVVASELMDEPGDNFIPKLVALGLSIGGLMVLSVASLLWTLSQHSGDCSLLDFKRESLRMRARRLDEALVPFAVLAFVAGWMIAVGFTIFFTYSDNLYGRGLLVLTGIWFFVWTTGMIVATVRFLYTHAREQAAAAERARSDATESQLAALQAQMNPHFLFNTLNTVASLVRTDAAAAEATVENLAVVLRRTLDRSRRVLSPVDEEIDHLAAYLSVAKQRYGDRLAMSWSVEPEARDLLLPTMTLQPLVENALKHGIGARMEGGALHIGVQLEGRERVEEAGDAVAAGGRLVLEVADDGPGFPRRHHEGTGLGNLRARLTTLYGDEANLRIERGGPGARVIVSLPVVRSATEVLGGTPDSAPPAGATESAPAQVRISVSNIEGAE